MLSLPSRRLAALLTLLVVSATGLHAELDIIAKARAYLGSEAALNAVNSVHYSGTMLMPNPADPAKPVSVAIDIIFQAPYRQRTVRTTDTLIDTIALDTYDGWHRAQDLKAAGASRVQVLPTDQVKRQRAIVQENLGFFRGLEREGGRVVDLGATTVDGVACRKVAFMHSDDIIFYRYFDAASGRLVLSEAENGSSIRERGEIRVNGVRFARQVMNTSRNAAGKEQTVTIIFDTITLNESLPDSTFAIPSFTGK